MPDTHEEGSLLTSKQPPKHEDFVGTTLSLFQNFLHNTNEQREKLSNTVEMWDILPKYSITLSRMNKLRTKDGFLAPFSRSFQHRGIPCEITINAAVIKRSKQTERFFKTAGDADRTFKAFYPSANEEVIEDCLRKIASDQYSGFFEDDHLPSLGAKFTLYQLSKELKKRGHSRSYHEIVMSIDILAGSTIDVQTSDGKIKSREAFLSYGRVSESGDSSDPQMLYYVRFHSLVARSVKALTYRQYDYDNMLSHKMSLARWLHKKLAYEYRNAAPTTTYNIKFSSIQRDSGYLNSSRTNDNKKQLEDALNELKGGGVLMLWSRKVFKQGKSIDDISYQLTPSHTFVARVKASNKRQNEHLLESDTP